MLFLISEPDFFLVLLAFPQNLQSVCSHKLQVRKARGSGPNPDLNRADHSLTTLLPPSRLSCLKRWGLIGGQRFTQTASGTYWVETGTRGEGNERKEEENSRTGRRKEKDIS